MNLKAFMSLSIFLISESVASISIPNWYHDEIGAKTTIVNADADGNLVLKSFYGIQSEPKLPESTNPQENYDHRHNTTIYKIFKENSTETRVDYVSIPENFTRATNKRVKRAASKDPAVIELVIVVDKELGDLFQQNYQKIVDYLTIYFWDVNMRYKTLWSVDLSIRVNGILIMDSKEAQPFIEKARGSDGRTEHGRTLNLFKYWIYQQRSWLVRHDMAVLMTHANSEWGGGLAHAGGACTVDTNSGVDLGTVVWNDDGDFRSVTIGTHEMAHNVGAPHDDDPNEKCPGPYGFIMSGGDEDRRYFFQKCSDAKISSFVYSESGACLRRWDGYETTPMDRWFSIPKAGSMQEMCKAALSNPNAFVDEADTYNCKTMHCKRRDDSNHNVYWIHNVAPIDNIKCGMDGRCFRGRCRPESKLLKNEASGLCMNAESRTFGKMIPAKMVACPMSIQKIPLDTVEIQNVPTGKLLATPFLDDENKESGDRCFWTGTNNGDWVWTDKCSSENPWHVWEFRSINGNQNRFQLVHKQTGRCARIISKDVGSHVYSTTCSTDSSMIWSWSDGI